MTKAQLSSQRRLTRLTAAMAVMAACFAALWAASAQAAQITGIADENLGHWSPATWSAFEATGVKQVRHIVAWNVAVGHAQELSEAKQWIEQAEAHHLEVLISFNYNYSEKAKPPLASAYKAAVEAFRIDFPSVSTYTAWNEPNHKVTKYPDSNPYTEEQATLAAEYWLELNTLCHEARLAGTCTVVGGDFSDGPATDLTTFNKYMEAYRARLKKAGPPIWAIHPYSAIKPAGSWSVVAEGFAPKTENKPIWFTEVGAMACDPKNGPQTTQNEGAGNLLALMAYMSEGGRKLEKTYYYAFSQANGGAINCVPGTDGTYQQDSELLANEIARPAYHTLFPSVPAPAVETRPASTVGATQATLNGNLIPYGLHTSYHFEYGPTTAYGANVPVPDGDAGFGTGVVGESATVSGLQPGTTYHYRIVASNTIGVSYGADATFRPGERIADISGDGRSDSVQCSNNEYVAATSNGSRFGAPASWSPWACSSLARLADFSGDGKADLIVPGGGTSWAVGVSSGAGFNGPGTTMWLTSLTNSPTWDGVGDFNGDGKADFVTCLNNEYKVDLSTGSQLGAPSVWSPWACSSLAQAADFTGDGKADVIVPAGGTSWAVGVSSGSGFNGLGTTMWLTNVSNSPTWDGVGDFNGDGKADFVTCLNNEYKVYLSTGSGFGAPSKWSPWACSSLAQIGDFNGDGKADLMVPSVNNTWAVALSSGTGFNAPGTETWLWGFTTQPTWNGARDISGDGRSDSVQCSNNEYVAATANVGFFDAPASWSPWACSSLARLADFSGDGKADLIVPGGGTSWAVGVSSGAGFNGPGTTMWLTSLTNSPTWDGVGDFNGDGKADFVTCLNNEYKVDLSTGSQLGAPSVWSPWACSSLAQAADFTGDGKADVIVPAGGTSWAVGVSSGSGFNGLGTTMWLTNVSNSPTWDGVGDFNGDGKADFVTCLNNEYKVYLSTGSGFGAPSKWSPWACSSLAQIGDFNGDGKADLMVPSVNNTWAVALSSGTGFNAPGTETWLWGFTTQPTWNA